MSNSEMVAMTRRFFTAPVFASDDKKTRTAYLLHVVTLTLFLLFATLIVVRFLPVFGGNDIRLIATGFLCLMLLGVNTLARFSYVRPASILLIAVFWSA